MITCGTRRGDDVDAGVRRVESCPSTGYTADRLVADVDDDLLGLVVGDRYSRRLMVKCEVRLFPPNTLLPRSMPFTSLRPTPLCRARRSARAATGPSSR